MQQVTSVAQGCTIGLEPLHFRQRQALNSVLPLGDNHVTVSRYLITGQVAMQMPFASQSLDEAGGGYYGQSKESGNLVLCDRKRLASPMGFVCGKPGSGKSFSVKREITNTVLAHPEDEVVIFDPAGEYGNLVGALGGANVELAPGCSAVLNPLDTADVADRADAAKLAYKTDAVLALSSALMAEGREGLPERDRSIIARCVGEAYRECARDGRLPTLGDFHAALLAQPEPEAADIALRYERYVKGAFSFFNGQSNVALDNRITNIDMHGLGQAEQALDPLGLLRSGDSRHHVVDAHAGKRRVLGAQAHGVAPERLGRGGALGHGERAGEVVRGVEQRHRPLVVDALYHAAGHPLVGGVVLREQRVGGLAPVPGDHLPRAVADLSHERQVGEAVLSYGLGELGYASRVHGVRGVRRVVGDVCHRDLRHRVAPAGARRAVEKPRDGEARGHLARRAHGTPRRRAPRSRARGGSPARMPPPASTASCPRRPCCSRG